MISVGSSTPTTQKLPRAPFVVARICCVAPAHAAIKASLLSAGTCQRYITWIIELALQILAPGWFPAAGRIHFLHENSWRRTHFLRRGPCPLWVKSRHVQRKTACLLYPRKRTFVAGRRLVRRIKNSSTKLLSHQSCKTGGGINSRQISVLLKVTYERARSAVPWCNVSSSHSIQTRSDTVAFALRQALPVATEAGGWTRHLRHQFGGELPHRQGEALTAGGVAHCWLASGQDRARHRHLRLARHY